MRLFFPLLFSMLSMLVSNAQQPGDLVLDHVNILPMHREKLLVNQTVTIRNGRIQSIRPTGRIRMRPEVHRIDCSGKFLMPGLTEMHAHIPPIANSKPMQQVLSLFLANGITLVRGMLGHPLHLQLREQLGAGTLMGPTLITSGPSLNGKTVTSKAQADSMVLAQKQAGYDFLKLHPGLSRENFLAIASAARKNNIPFAGHVSFDVGISTAIREGYATIDHMDGFIESLVPGIEHMDETKTGLFGMYIADHADTTGIPKLLNDLREKGVWIVPTEALSMRWFSPLVSAEELAKEPEMQYMNSKTVQQWTATKNNLRQQVGYQPERMLRFLHLRKRILVALKDHRVGLLLGSDAPQVFNVPGFSTHQELAYYVEAGFTPFEALKTGTVNVGKFLKRDDIGVVRTGALADLLLLDANPLEQITNTRKINAVIRNGKWLSREQLEKMLVQVDNY